MSTPFRTLTRVCEVSGIGLHSGETVRARLRPRSATGIVFRRADLPGAPVLAAAAHCIASTHHATTLIENGVRIGTPEHLLAALWMLGVTHCEVELNGEEVPILDGSAQPWCELLRDHLQELDGARPEYSLREPVAIYAREGAVIALPHPTLRITIDVEYGVPYLVPQLFGGEVTLPFFERELAPARTFTLQSWIEPLRAAGLIKGGSPANALGLLPDAPTSPLRFPEEPARHKAVDLLGDVALLFAPDGGVLRAHLIAVRAGHELHRLWMQAALHKLTAEPPT